MESVFAQLKAALEAGTFLSAFFAVILAYFGGILSSFTPCIYPMIPITIGFIGGSEERTVRRSWALSSFYVLGMASIYTVLGIVASLSGKIFGTMTNTPTWYVVLGTIMVISSLWMFDVIKFDPNVWLDNFKRKRAGGQPVAHHPKKHVGTIWGAFVLGASSGFIAAPCTTPVLTTILSYIATQGSVVFGAFLMFAFACGLGTILVVIGTFAGTMKMLPKSGHWLNAVKYGSALLILALGEYFVFKAGTLAGFAGVLCGATK